jgi:acylphosphatase
MAVTKQLRIAGRVQGVGFRYALQREALARGLAGWVRNRPDGTVEALLQGGEAAVDAVIVWARRGPPAARVHEVEIQVNPGGQRYAGFEQLPTE